jgi:hypothetical protein
MLNRDGNLPYVLAGTIKRHVDSVVRIVKLAVSMVRVTIYLNSAVLASPPNHVINSTFRVRISTSIDNLPKLDPLPCIFAGKLKNVASAEIDLGSLVFIWSIIKAVPLLRLVRTVSLAWDLFTIAVGRVTVWNAIVLKSHG